MAVPKSGTVTMTKPPYVPVPGKKRHALVNVRSTWGTFEQAKNTLESGGFDGIGFVLGEGIFGIDFDHADDAMVQEALSLGSYTEWSPSGHGVHVIGRSRFVLKGRKKGSVELYMKGRYFTVTGSLVSGSPATLREIPPGQMTDFFRRHFEDVPAPAGTMIPAEGVWGGVIRIGWFSPPVGHVTVFLPRSS